MKVCTDACILGAWFAATIGQVDRVLDIGSGTGLLMLMLAQKVEADIDGVEIEERCFEQLEINISHAPWSARVRASYGDIRTYSAAAPYSFIITNPPFYENDLVSADSGDQLAKHSQQLSLRELVESIDKHLNNQGTFGVLLPYHRWKYFDTLATGSGFHPLSKAFIRHSPSHPHFRAILHYGRQPGKKIEQTNLSIHKCEGGYSDEVSALLKDYYLYL